MSNPSNQQDLARAIERYLLDYPGDGWVASKTICARFGIDDRQLRSVGSLHGLCSAIAISSDKGFKHVERATPKEYLQFKHRLRRHGVGELRRVRALDQRRHQVTVATKRPEFLRERDTNQGLLFHIPAPTPW